jgi:hypothetical protein
MDQLEKIIRGLQIFDRLMPKGANKPYRSVAAEHDVLYSGPNPDDVSEADKAELEELGWHVDEALECFYHFS